MFGCSKFGVFVSLGYVGYSAEADLDETLGSRPLATQSDHTKHLTPYS